MAALRVRTCTIVATSASPVRTGRGPSETLARDLQGAALASASRGSADRVGGNVTSRGLSES